MSDKNSIQVFFKNSPKITKKWYHVGISKEFPLISVVSCWYFKDKMYIEVRLPHFFVIFNVISQ